MPAGSANETDPAAASQMYLDNTKVNVDKLVGLLDQVAAITDAQVADNQSGLMFAVQNRDSPPSRSEPSERSAPAY